ncbi:MAG TPA: DUF4395 domain-containing protein [Saprospiraceae bacterium]|nr:DUF4395 domain-containing protein [Saprospiraceae bacterium]
MSGSNTVVCPISTERINENVVRLVALLVIAVAVVGWLTVSWLAFLLLAVDFGLRAFSSGFYSPLRQLAQWIARKSSLGIKLTDAAPKKFAAGIGLIFALSISLALTLNWEVIATGLSGILVVCAFLESALGFCVGCVVYSLLNRFLVLTALK